MGEVTPGLPDVPHLQILVRSPRVSLAERFHDQPPVFGVNAIAISLQRGGHNAHEALGKRDSVLRFGELIRPADSI